MQVDKIEINTEKMDEILQQMPGRVTDIIRRTGLAVMGKAMSLAPVDTGALKNSIHLEITSPASAIVADGVEYGIYQELGTYKMAAHPFLVPALESERQEFTQAFEELIQ
jgi:HK97 gp10 family phage protein